MTATSAIASAVSGRARLATVVAAGALLLWPTLLNGHPYLFWDTYGYFTHGRDYWTLIRAALGLIPPPPEAAQGWTTAAGRMLDHDPALRSIPYSLLFWPAAVLGSMWAVAALHAAAATYAVDVALERLLGLGARGRVAAFAALAALSPLPWFASYLMPDLFGGLMLLAGATLAFAWERLARTQKAALAALVLLAASFHTANLMLGAALAVAGALMAGRGRRLATALRTGLPLLGAVLLLLGLNLAFFGRPALSPKNPPFLLARQAEDGPLIPYLRERCGRPGEEAWALCPHVDRLWPTAQEFLWAGEDSYWAWDRDMHARLRAEEGRLVLRAALERPWLQLRASAWNALRQLGMIGLDDFLLGRGAVVVPEDYWYAYLWDAPVRRHGLGAFGAALHVVAALSVVAILWLAWPPRGSGRATLPREAWLLLLGIVLNAAVCGALSGPHNRYQARVAWLLPLLAAALVVRRREEESRVAAAVVPPLPPPLVTRRVREPAAAAP